MAVIKIEAKKDTRCTQTICLIRGDRRTQILRFGVNRYDGGVDLSDLAWVIKTVNANGVEDVFDPEAVEIGESRITVDWLVEGSVTDADGLAKYELNGLDTVGEDAVPVIWRGGTGTISLRADISPKFGESDGMTNIEKLILYVDGELQNVIDAGSAAADAAARANRAADNVEDLSGAVERANTAAQRATDAAAAVEDLEGAVTRANSAATLATNSAMNADMAASMAYSAATRATEAAKNVENIEEATVAAYDAADDARMAAEVANAAGLPAAMIYGTRVKGETAKATGNPVSFLPDAGSLLQPVTVLEPQQEGSGDPSPENIRPFIGYDKLDLNVTGKNLIDLLNPLYMHGNSDYVKEKTSNSVVFSGTISSIWSSQRFMYHLPAGEYSFSAKIETDKGYKNLGIYKSDKLTEGYTYLRMLTDSGSVNFILDKPSYIEIRPHFTGDVSTQGETWTTRYYDIQLECNSAPSAFEPYQGTLHTVQIGQTVYGFRYEWLTGKAWIEWAMATLDGTEAFQTSNYGAHFYLYVYTAPTSSDGSVINVLSSHFKGVAESDRMGNEPLVYLMSDHNAVEFRNTGCVDVTAWKTYLAAQNAAGTPVQIVYKLATPIEIQLTPHIISAVDPEQNNTLYGDGSIEVEYVKPLHVAIEERVAAVLAAAAE